MSKIKYLILLIPLLFISKVSALSINDNVIHFNIDNVTLTRQLAVLNNHSNEINQLITYWENNYSNAYPYYYINGGVIDNSHYTIQLYFSVDPYVKMASRTMSNSSTVYDITFITSAMHYTNGTNKPYNMIEISNGVFSVFDPDTASGWNNHYPLYWLTPTATNWYSYGGSIPIISNGLIYSSTDINNNVLYDKLVFDSLSTSSLSFNSFEVYDGDNIPSIKALLDNSYTPDNSNNYTEIDLNNYAYVSLSLRNYSQSSFETNIYTLGRLCLTRVYDYGTSEAYNPQFNDYANGCTNNYDTFTPVRLYVNDSFINNHSIWYVKSYNYDIPNKIKVDPSVFEINYIDFADSQNPVLTINGSTYNSIPFNNLSSTANMSTANGYVSGEVNSIFDTMSNDNVFQNILEHPLQSLTAVWSSVLSIFGVIGVFISLLPPILQSFLILAFSIGIILGILKIII